MAKGILVGEAEYYGDETKYTGEVGASTNRYIIEDCYDFIAFKEVYSDSNTYGVLVNDIDFNDHDTYANGFTSTINNYAHNLDGDGHTIMNINALGLNSALLIFNTIKNCTLANLTCVSCTGSVFEAQTMVNCHFGIYLSNSVYPIYQQQMSTGYMFEECTFDIVGFLSDGGYISLYECVKCHYKFNLTMNHYVVFDEGNYVTFSSSYITGKIKNTYVGAHEIMTHYCGAIQAYMAMEYEAPNADTISPPVGDSCFMDVEVFGHELVADDSSFALLTTEEAMTSDVLTSIGFVAIPTKRE